MAEVVGAATLWGLVSLSFMLYLLRAPAPLLRTSLGLLVLEFLALLAWGYGRSAGAAAVAFEHLPTISAALVGAAAVYGLRRHYAAGVAPPRK